MGEWKRNILVTGGAGFIGSHVVDHFVRAYPQYRVVCMDSLTYAGSMRNLAGVSEAHNFAFEPVDICDAPGVQRVFREHAVDAVIHLAAESHVDRSIADPLAFARTNVMGTLTLLEAARRSWEGATHTGRLFYHVSTDEVYGSLAMDAPPFTESSPYGPRSPYSASKASSDHFVRAYHETYRLPVVLSNCSNNYGPRQYPEKLIPLFIRNIAQGKPLPVYGSGANVRDWLHVRDHVRAIDAIFHRGRMGETYNVGGGNEWRNIDLVHALIAAADRQLGNPAGHSLGLIRHVEDRAGHDLRYAIDAAKLRGELGWAPTTDFTEGLEDTVAWFLGEYDG